MEPEDVRRRIFTAMRLEPEDVRAFNDMYPGYTPANLDTHNVMEDGDCSVLVHKNHPVIDLLHLNADILNMDIYLQERVDGKWHRIRKMLMRMACEIICKALGQAYRASFAEEPAVELPVGVVPEAAELYP